MPENDSFAVLGLGRPTADADAVGVDGVPRMRGRRGRAPRTGRARRALLISLALALVLVGGAAFAFQRVQASYDRNIERFGDPFEAIPPAERPQPPVTDAMNILLVGSDSRVSAGDPSQWTAGAQRTDAIMIMHVPADRSGAYVISIPRDSWVDIPGRGKAKVNAGYSYGGPTLMIRTLEKLTGVRLDHMVIVDFEGFKEITDALGGVTITVPQATGDDRASFRAGTYQMDGATALTYVRQRKNLPGGDFDRVRRQQNWIRAVVRETVSAGTLTNPLKLNDVLQATTRSIATDDNFTIGKMRSLALSMRDVRARDISFVTAPVQGTGRSADGQSIVLLDGPANGRLWRAVAQDDMAAWVAANTDALLGRTVR